MKKTILITGCSSGFGYHTAVLLAHSGYGVIATVRKTKDLKVFSELPKSLQPTAILLDVTWPQAKIDTTIRKIISNHKHIDVLVNNAGFGFLGAVETISATQFQEQLDVNLLGLFKVTKAVLPGMRKRHSGLVINISSIAGLVTFAGYGIYSASKFAVEALTQSLRAEEAVFNIDVVSINPGSFETRFWENEKFPSLTEEKNIPTLSRFNKRIQKAVQKSNSYRSHPRQVSKKIKNIIESRHRHLNNLVGLDAHFIYFLSLILPRQLLVSITKRMVSRLA